LQSIEREAIAVSAMLDQLLFLARAEDGKLAFHVTEVDFSAIVREVSNGFLPVASDRAVQLVCEIPPCEVPVVGDALALRRLATNLLDNAVKFTPAGGRVTVTLGQEKSEAHLTVKDTGCGIPSDDLRKIFRRFYRVDAAKTAGMGSGLGLAIVESVAAAHQGNLSVVSKPGEGSAFTFRMSVTASKRPASQPEVAATVTH
jgi:signal transduction histidine kinase